MFYIVEKPRDRFWTDVKFLLKNSGNLGGNGGGRMAATEVRNSSECRAAVWFVSAFKEDVLRVTKATLVHILANSTNANVLDCRCFQGCLWVKNIHYLEMLLHIHQPNYFRFLSSSIESFRTCILGK